MPSRLLSWFIAFVWLANGLLAKVLGLVPRHEAIVARILGEDYAGVFTVLIGLSEIAVASWVITGKARKLTAAGMIALVLTMNVLETILATDLLLWGPGNLVFAIGFCGLLYLHGFYLNNEPDAA